MATAEPGKPGPQAGRAEEYLAPETLAQLIPFELRARAIAEGAMHGMHRSPRQGSAVEFSAHRLYASGDSVRHLDWKVFGRTDRLYVKQYRQETNLEIGVLVDSSASMRFGTLAVKSGWGGTDASRRMARWTKWDHATACAAAIAYLCLSQRDRVGASVFAKGIRANTRRSASQSQWRSIVQLLSLEPVDGTADLVRSINQLLAKGGERLLLCILSDFLMPEGEVREALGRIKHAGHDAILLAIPDHSELHMDLEDPRPFLGLEGEGVLEADPLEIRAAYLEEMRLHLETLERTCVQLGFDLQVLDSQDSVGTALAALLARREHFNRRRSA